MHDIFGEDDTTKSFRTHNISALILKAEKYGFTVDDELKDMSADITQWEAGTRYSGDIVTTREDISVAIEICKKLNTKIIAQENTVTKTIETEKEKN